jgi:hypothetical protein
MKTTRIALLIGLSLTVGLVVGACSAGTSPTPPVVTPLLPPDAPVTSPPDGGGVDPACRSPVRRAAAPATRRVSLAPMVEGGVTVRADWVARALRARSRRGRLDGTTFTVALFEGSSDLNVACIEIAATRPPDRSR